MTERKRNVNAALDKTSETIHNTRAVAKKSYVHPAIIDLYLNHPRKFAASFIATELDAERAFMAYLSKSECASGGDDDSDDANFDPREFWI